jgi:hypothetical protein
MRFKLYLRGEVDSIFRFDAESMDSAMEMLPKLIPRMRMYYIQLRELDRCVKCDGDKGGVPGKETLVDGKPYCEYCSAEQTK